MKKICDLMEKVLYIVGMASVAVSLCAPQYRYVPVYSDSRRLLQKKLPTPLWHGAALSDQHQWFAPMNTLNLQH